MLNLESLDFVVIEDHKPMQAVIRTILCALHVKHIRFCDDAAAALQEMRTAGPDIVIADYDMQPMDGLEFIRLVRRDSDSPDPFVPIILLTGYSEKRIVLEARDAGATEILAKPVSVKVLYDRVESIIEHPRPFVRASRYFGPDRRRKARKFEGEDRRQMQDPAVSTTPAVTSRCDRTTGVEEHVPS